MGIDVSKNMLPRQAVTKQMLIDLGFDENKIIVYNRPLIKIGNNILRAREKDFESLDDIKDDEMLLDSMVSGILIIYESWYDDMLYDGWTDDDSGDVPILCLRYHS